MTSVFSFTTPRVAVQVSDRQLSRNGSPVDSEANKAVIIRTADAVMSFAYTGPAWTRTKPTDHWLAETLYGRPLEAAFQSFGPGPPGRGDIGGALHRLTRELDRCPPGWRTRGAAIVGCGVRRRADRRSSMHWPVIYTVNYDATRRRFAMSSALPRREAMHVLALSCEGARQPADPDGVLRRASADTEPVATEQLLINETRALAKEDPGLIGPHLMAVRFTPSHSGITTSVAFAPASTDSRPTYELGTAAATGAYTPWIVAPGAASAPSLVTGVNRLRIGALVVELRDVPNATPVQIEGGGKRYVSGGRVQPRRGWPHNVRIPPLPDD